MPDKPPTPWKMPPLIKVYEALGAVADGRVRLVDDGHALVTSSDGSKTYAVEWAGRVIAANDNASYWQGYLGYPAIAVMIARGVIRAEPTATAALRDLPWKALNTRFHNDYARTLGEVAGRLATDGADPASIAAACTALLATLRQYAPLRGPRRRPPAGKPAAARQ